MMRLRAARVFACFALIFFMKKNRARNLVQSPVQKLAEKGSAKPSETSTRHLRDISETNPRTTRVFAVPLPLE